jgi:serine/threonine protein kinase
MWSVGVTIYKIITGKTPFESEYLSDTINNINKGEIKFDDFIWREYSSFAKDLVIRLLKRKSDRLSAKEAKKHLWFNSGSQDIEILKKNKPNSIFTRSDTFNT